LLDSEHRAELRKAVIAGTFGTTVEWHDFIFCSVATGLVFANSFFPQSDPLVGVLQRSLCILSALLLVRLVRSSLARRKAALIATHQRENP